jgi:hypothetical protein
MAGIGVEVVPSAIVGRGEDERILVEAERPQLEGCSA